MKRYFSRFRWLFYCIVFVVVAWLLEVLFVVVWQPHTLVFSPNQKYQDNFGAAIAIDGDTLERRETLGFVAGVRSSSWE